MRAVFACWVLGVVGVASSIPAAVGKDSMQFEVEGLVGRSYDSNVSVDEFDINTQLGDHTTNIDLKAGFEKSFTKRVVLNAAYSLADTSYTTYGDFDRRTGMTSATFAYTLPKKVS